MREAGYATHAVGKWHLGFCAWDYTPTRRGFDSFFGFYSHSEDYYSRQSRDTSGQFSGYDLRSNESVTTEGAGLYSAELFAGKAAEVIRAHDRRQPLFLYLAFQSIHKPIQVPEKYARLYQPYGKLTKDSERRGMVTALDEAVKNVTRALKQNKMYRNTVIIFVSDNGGSYRDSNWPLRGRKNSVWEGGTRSVAFVSYPKMAEKWRGRVVNDLVHIVDWYPTVLSLAGYKEKLEGLDGQDQWLTVASGRPGPRKSLVYNINDALRFTAAIRVGKWKLIWGYPEGLRSNVSRKATRAAFAQNLGEANNLDLLHLFNLDKDPNETVNLAKNNRGMRKKLMKKVRKIMRSGEVVKPDTPFLRQKSLPVNFGGVVSPGWCSPR
jgi:arylsulfatase A-like enzyme